MKIFGQGEHVDYQVLMETGGDKLHRRPIITIGNANMPLLHFSSFIKRNTSGNSEDPSWPPCSLQLAPLAPSQTEKNPHTILDALEDLMPQNSVQVILW